MVAEAEGHEWVQPEPEAEAESQPELLSEAEFHAKLDRIVADAEVAGRRLPRQQRRRLCRNPEP